MVLNVQVAEITNAQVKDAVAVEEGSRSPFTSVQPLPRQETSATIVTGDALTITVGMPRRDDFGYLSEDQSVRRVLLPATAALKKVSFSRK